MDSLVARKILTINYQFYQSFAPDFSDSRGRVQPGVLRILDRLEPRASILDLGCGNGQLARQLAASRFKGSYLGTDFSPALLEIAALGFPGGFQADFALLDLAEADWSGFLPDQAYTAVLCFAALHHIPSHDLRASAVKNIRRYTADHGTACFSNWQFLNSGRFRKRILKWESVGIKAEEVDEGDYLLDWRRGGQGIRYVHHFSQDELEMLAAEGGFTVRESYYSDGKEGDLSLYQIWEPS